MPLTAPIATTTRRNQQASALNQELNPDRLAALAQFFAGQQQNGGIGTQEQVAIDRLWSQADRDVLSRSGINQFFQDPRRAQEINRVVGAGMDQAMTGLEFQLDDRSRQEAFNRARSGNMGGSFQARQEALLQTDADLNAAQIAAQAEQQRDQLARAMEAQRVQEILQTLQLNPFVQDQVRQQLSLLGVQGAGNQAMNSLELQQQRQDEFFNDELSRAFGNLVNVFGQQYTIDQQADMLGRRGVI